MSPLSRNNVVISREIVTLRDQLVREVMCPSNIDFAPLPNKLFSMRTLDSSPVKNNVQLKRRSSAANKFLPTKSIDQNLRLFKKKLYSLPDVRKPHSSRSSTRMTPISVEDTEWPKIDNLTGRIVYPRVMSHKVIEAKKVKVR